MSKNGGKSKSAGQPNGQRRIEGKTGKKFAPKSLRHKHKYESECSDIELVQAKVKREA